ncbi:ROK family protein [Lentzea guizhouensis]|uniref:ROK family protein n=1 Tax=Lentzea guizhouensis TaxID=1586287 RepID=UPI003AAF009B
MGPPAARRRPPCECGATGCWEQYASGPALVAEARRHWTPARRPANRCWPRRSAVTAAPPRSSRPSAATSPTA